MKIVFCWPGINGYMAACWRALQRRAEISVFAFHPAYLADSDFAPDFMRGVRHAFFDPTEPSSTEKYVAAIRDFDPEFVYLPSWGYPALYPLPFRPELRHCRFIMGMDNPWRGTLKQRVGRFWVFRYLRCMEKVLVPGERAYQFAVRLGIPEDRIARCAMYGVDYTGLAPLFTKRVADGWPRRFLFVGRYVREKGLDTLVSGYRRYRSEVGSQAWELACCGKGELAYLLRHPGIEDHGFVQPDQLAVVIAGSGVLVHPARLDHWPLAIVEAASAGLPIIASEACGSVVEVVRPYENGITVPAGDVERVAAAMLWMHERYSNLPSMGRRSQQHASSFSAEAWTERLINTLGTKRRLVHPTEASALT